MAASYSTSLPTPTSEHIKTLRSLALSASLIASTSLATVSLVAVPAILSAVPDTSRPGAGGSPCAGIVEKLEQSTRTKVALAQFAIVYAADRAALPLGALATAAMYGGVAWWARRSRLWVLYAAAAGLVGCVLPVTLADKGMDAAGRSLLRIGGVEAGMTAEERALKKDFEAEAAEVRRLLVRWRNWNGVRAALMLAAGGLGVWAGE